MKYYGAVSNTHLYGVKPEVQALCIKALELAGNAKRDISIVDGLRTTKEQQALYAKGRTQLNGVDKLSYHQNGNAIDFTPFVNWQRFKFVGRLTGNSNQVSQLVKVTGLSSTQVWERVHREFHGTAMFFYLAAHELGYKITWGGDWNNDGCTLDNNFEDLGHIQFEGLV